MNAREQARSVLGAMLGVLLTGVICHFFIGRDAVAFWLVAPMGASAVLLFALPASPLAQPWAFVGGSVVSAWVGVACAQTIPAPLAAAGIAVGAATLLMFVLRCMHPPGGAVALGAALGGPVVAKFGFFYALVPVGLNAVLLVLVAVAYNRLCGRRYPHLAMAPAAKADAGAVVPLVPVGIVAADLDQVLKQYNQMLDISRDDLEEILLRTQLMAANRRFGEITCGDMMRRDVATVEFGTALEEAWQRLVASELGALVVVDCFHHVIGMLTQDDFVRHCGLTEARHLASRLRRLLNAAPGAHSEKPEVVGQIMGNAVRRASSEQSIISAAPLFHASGLHCLPVVSASNKLLGVLGQSDLINALCASQLEQASYLQRKTA